MKCFNCGAELIWQNCFDFDDYGLTDEGIVTVLWCPNCDTYWEGYQKLNNELTRTIAECKRNMQEAIEMNK